MKINFDDMVKALILFHLFWNSWDTSTLNSSSISNIKLRFDDIYNLILSQDVQERLKEYFLFWFNVEY